MRIKSFFVIVAIWAFVVSPLLRGIAFGALVRLPSGKFVDITQTELEALKAQPGIQITPTIPEIIEPDAIVVALPAELGGGYIIGTPEAIAAAFNAVGITVGATALFIEGVAPALLTGATLVGWGIIVALVEAIAEEEEEAAVHHAVAHH